MRRSRTGGGAAAPPLSSPPLKPAMTSSIVDCQYELPPSPWLSASVTFCGVGLERFWYCGSGILLEVWNSHHTIMFSKLFQQCT